MYHVMKSTAITLLLVLPVAAQQASPPVEPEVTWHNLSKLAVEGKGWSKTKHPYDRLPAEAEADRARARVESCARFGRFALPFR